MLWLKFMTLEGKTQCTQVWAVGRKVVSSLEACFQSVIWRCLRWPTCGLIGGAEHRRNTEDQDWQRGESTINYKRCWPFITFLEDERIVLLQVYQRHSPVWKWPTPVSSWWGKRGLAHAFMGLVYVKFQIYGRWCLLGQLGVSALIILFISTFQMGSLEGS